MSGNCYRCDACPHCEDTQPALIHHRWVDHALRGPVRHLRGRRPKPPPPPKVVPPAPEPVAVRLLPGVFVASGLPRRFDPDAARRRAFEPVEGFEP